MMAERVLLVPLWVRIWHWITALLFLVLIVTGVVMHFATPRFMRMDYAAATSVHDIAGIVLAVSYGLYLIPVFVTGYWRQYIPTSRGLWRRLRDQLVFYTVGVVRGEQGHPTAVGKTRFNPLQQLVYLVVVFVILPLLVVSGLLYLYPESAPEQVLSLDGLWTVASAHYLLGVIGTVYLIIHIYMATLGGMRGMITGCAGKVE